MPPNGNNITGYDDNSGRYQCLKSDHGGITYLENGGSAHITMYDGKHGTRLSYDINPDGSYTKHETNQNVNRCHPERRHGDGAYRDQSDTERGGYLDAEYKAFKARNG